MHTHYPSPDEVGIAIPPHLREDRFCHGFHHALSGGHITQVDQLKLSFREGYRCGKLYLRELRRQRGILQFPMRARVRMRAVMH
jgi:hypothetical protein